MSPMERWKWIDSIDFVNIFDYVPVSNSKKRVNFDENYVKNNDKKYIRKIQSEKKKKNVKFKM